MNKSFHIYARIQRMKHIKFIWLVVAFLSLQSGFAQQNMDPDFLRSTGKIYVVAIVTFVILLSLFAYMINLDRKISRLEKRHKNE